MSDITMGKGDICNSCGDEADELRFLKLPDDSWGWEYCKPCWEKLKQQVLEETGEWPYGEF